MARPDAAHLLEVATAIAREAGAVIRTSVPSPRRIATKESAVDLVTDTDHRVDALIAERLAAAFPDHARLTEEGGAWVAEGTAPICWVVDPLDGTVNFAHGVPHFAVSIAAVAGFRPGGRLDAPGAEVVVGVVYDPMRDETFAACDRGPARLDGAPIVVSRRTALDEALIATGFPYDRRERFEEYLEDWRAVLPRCRDLRRTGAASLDLAWVAAGRLDAYWERGLHPWDVAAGALIVRRAGGLATDFGGRDLVLDAAEVLAAPPSLHDALRALLPGAVAPR